MTTRWLPPGEGEWKRDEVHITQCVTRFLASVQFPSQVEGFERGFAEFGMTLAGFDMQTVAGHLYMRPRIAGAPPQKIWGDKPPAKIKPPGGPPPKFVFKLLFLLHPDLRRRAKRAAEVWRDCTWRAMTKRWNDETRPRYLQRCRELTRVDVTTLDDSALANHLESALDTHRELIVQHFIHAAMAVVVLGDYLARTSEWVDATAAEKLELLQGSSPASRAGADHVQRIAVAIATDASAREILTSARPAADIVTALRAGASDVGRAMTEYLEDHGHRIFTGLDLTHATLLELPDLLVRALRAGVEAHDRGAAAPVSTSEHQRLALRERIPADKRDAFDVAFSDARLVYGVRDDDVGFMLWQFGLVKRAVREIGARLVKRGAIHETEHSYDAEPAELLGLIRGNTTPSADTLAARTAERAANDKLDPPAVLGQGGPMPDPDVFPPAVARMQRGAMAYIDAMLGREGAKPIVANAVTGTSVSAGVYEGRARVVYGPADFERIERGDVLVARATSPAYNVLLPLLGAIVTERGGVLSHAAIVAREYGIPGVVDTRNAMTAIPDGAIVRVDGTTGSVRIVRAPDNATATVSAPPTKPASATSTPVYVPRTAGRVVSLRDAVALDFGGKAKALAGAVAAGLRVPDGLALDADLVARVVAGESAAREQVQAAVAALPAPWAVRSSAVGEDSAQASFAGQHSTVLGVTPTELFEAIAAVHASGHTDAALAYRARMNVTGAPRMGVVIQTLLRPDISGVMFSRDPSATAREGRLIEATWGLGEALVAGLVTPDRYRVAADGRVLERAIGDKDIAIEAQADGGTAEIAVAGERAKTACLDDARIAELAQLASRCEQLFGGPQDLEWAVANGRLHLLQSRPVTAGAAS